MKLVKKYKIKLKRKDKKNLECQAELCRQLWNLALEQRIMAWKLRKITINIYDQKKELPGLKQEFPEFDTVYNKYLSAVLFRLEAAFKAFFRRIGNEEKPGFPRFKSKKRFFSLESPGDYCNRINDFTLRLPQGIVLKVKEKLPDKIGTIVIKKQNQSWYITIVSEVETAQPKECQSILAFDLGIKSLAVGFNGESFKEFHSLKQIRYFDKIVDSLKSKRSKCKKGSRRYRSYTKAIRRACHTISNKRSNHFHHVTKWIMTKEAENAIVVGDFKVREMLDENNNKLNRETQNRWAIHEFISMLSYKAKLYGKQFFTISEHNTTKLCSSCGSIKKMALANRIYSCDKCGFQLDRDQNSAINIYKRSVNILKLSLKQPLAVLLPAEATEKSEVSTK